MRRLLLRFQQRLRLSPFIVLIVLTTPPVANTQSLHFEKRLIASESFESVAVFDVDGDGELDIVSGAYWYEGPDFRNRHYMAGVERHGEYRDDFLTIPMDINGNGRLAEVVGGRFSQNLRWLENPGDHSRWTEHVIDQTGNVEAARAWDLDGDGHLEVVPNNPNDPLKAYKLERGADGQPAGRFQKIPIADVRGHGLGFGDVNGDGRGDFIVSGGWIEAPEDILEGEWVFHEEFDLGSASIPIIVADVNGTGYNDLIVGSAHDYGLDWLERRVDGAGDREWVRHAIDPYGSQCHSMEWVDIDEDGEPELVTGKRYRAHNGGDPGANDAVGLYYYKWSGDGFVKHTIASGPFGEGKGTGISFEVVDLNGSGLKDIVVAGKDGLYIFYNRGF